MSLIVELGRICEFFFYIENIIFFEFGVELKRIGKGEKERLDVIVGFRFLFLLLNNSR